MATKKLPQEIIDDLDNNTMFNKFGLVNISALRSRTGTTLEENDLKERIQNHFGPEMMTGEVEFIENKKIERHGK